MKLSWINPSDKVIHDSICIIFWRNMCMASIREDIIPNKLFQSLGELLAILSVARNVYFGDTRGVLLTGP